MRKFLIAFSGSIFLWSGVALTQTSPPPLYDVEEELPPDISVEKLPAKKVEPKEPEQISPPAAEVKPAEPKPETATEKIQVEAKEEVTLPTKPLTAPEPKPEITVPSDVSIVQVQPITTPSEVMPDGGPSKDAGSELAEALPITYASYEVNYLSPKDNVDTFKIFTRTQEGVGVVLKPKHASTQLVCDLLGENGAVLTQTQAPAMGQALAFQTSPFNKNEILYLRVRDQNLTPDTPATEQREYSLELRPIAAVIPPAAESPPPPPAPKPATPPAKVDPATDAEPMPVNLLQYGLVGVGILVLVVGLIILLRRRKPKSS